MSTPKYNTNQRLKQLTFPSLASLTLAACGGGGGGGGQMVQPTPTNRAPVAEANKTLTIDEDATNQALEIATPTDADGNSLTISVTAIPSGGTLAMADGTAVTTSSTLTISQLTGLVFTPDANLNDDTTTFGTFTYTVSDGSLTDSSTVTISVTPVNDAPELIGVMEFAIDENTTAVADITATDVDVGDSLTYSITGGDDQALFEIDSSTGKLSFITRPDYENPGNSNQNNTYTVEVTVTDPSGLTDTKTFTITVNDVTTHVAITNTVIDENDAGAIVGTLSAAIDDINATHEYTYTLSGADADSFEVVDGQLKLKDGIAANYEAQNSYSVTVTATDTGGLSTSEDFTITINDVNDAPTGMTISRTGLNNDTDGAEVGTLTTTDEDAGDSHTYTVSDDRFEVTSDGVLKLKAGQSIDNVAEPAVSLTVTSTDKGDKTVQHEFILTVGTVQITATTFEENAAGVVIGTLSVIDSSFSGNITYTLSGTGSENFEVVDSQLKLKDGITANYEVLSSYSITITATDASDYTKSTTYPFEVTDINDAPTGTSLSNMTFDENALGGIVGNLTTTDEDSGDTHTYTIPGFYGAFFEVVNGQLKLKDNFYYNYETTSGPLTITVTSTDSGGLSTTSAYTITVNDLNDKPTAVNLSGSLYVNNGAAGAVVGELTTTDEDAGDYHNYTLSGSDAAMFEVVDGKLKLKDSVTPTHSTQSTYSVTVTSTDNGDEAISETYTIDVNIAPTDITLDSYSVNESYYGLEVGSITTADPNSDDEFTYTLSGTDAASFEVTSSGTLKLKDSIYADYEVKDTYTVTVTAIDQGGLTFEKTLTIDVKDLDYATPYCSDIRPKYNITLSGDNDIDALLIGFSYDLDSDPDTPLTITYSLITTNSVFHPDYNDSDSTGYNMEGVEGLLGNVVNGSDAWETLVDQAFAYWSQVSGIKFEKVEETATQCGDIRIGLVSSWGGDSTASGFSVAGNLGGINDYGTSGDIWCLSYNDPENADNLGIKASITIVHEIGHSLGLHHPFADEGKLSNSTTENPTNAYTLMSYSGAAVLLRDWDIDGDGVNEYEFLDVISLQNPAINDIKAIQYIYGMTPDFNEGDTPYIYEGPVYASIYDTGGIDTIDLSFYSGAFEKNITLDLRGGSVSEIGTEEIFMEIYDPDTGDTEYQFEGFQLSISENTVIENAKTGSGDDTITCNTAINVINCGAGDDTVWSIAAGDTAYGDAGNDTFSVTNNSFTLIDGGAGNDTLYLYHSISANSSGDLSGYIDLRTFTDAQLTSIEKINILYDFVATKLILTKTSINDLEGTLVDVDSDGNNDNIVYIIASSTDKVYVYQSEGWTYHSDNGTYKYYYIDNGATWFAVNSSAGSIVWEFTTGNARAYTIDEEIDNGNPIIPIDIDSIDDNDDTPLDIELPDLSLFVAGFDLGSITLPDGDWRDADNNQTRPGVTKRDDFDYRAFENSTSEIASEINPLGLNEPGTLIEGIVLPENVPLAAATNEISEGEALNLLSELIDQTPSVAIDYQNTLLMDGDDPIDLVQQPLEHSMVTVNLVADLPFMDDYNPMLDHDMLFWSSELGNS